MPGIAISDYVGGTSRSDLKRVGDVVLFHIEVDLFIHIAVLQRFGKISRAYDVAHHHEYAEEDRSK